MLGQDFRPYHHVPKSLAKAGIDPITRRNGRRELVAIKNPRSDQSWAKPRRHTMAWRSCLPVLAAPMCSKSNNWHPPQYFAWFCHLAVMAAFLRSAVI
jgi:hypothetical protein